MLSKDQITAKTKLKTEVVRIPEWDGDVIVSEMTGEGRDMWEQSLNERDSQKRLVSPRAKLVVATVVDENGNAMFTEKDIPVVTRLGFKSLDRICQVANRLNSITEEALEDHKKNS
jgi:hypothetical protein